MVKHSEKQTFDLIALKRWHYPVHFALIIFTPIFSGYVSYIKAMDSVQTQFVQQKLENEQKFAQKDDVAKLEVKLNRIAEDLSEIKGYLFKRTVDKSGN